MKPGQNFLNEILKCLKSAGSLSDKQYKKIKTVGYRPGVLYGISHGVSYGVSQSNS